jgi:uncharacterized protein HemX
MMKVIPSFDFAKANSVMRIGSQPIAIAAAALIVIVAGVGVAALWRAYTGISPEQERVTAARLLQLRAAQASEQLLEKTKALETTQQETIDQLQVVQDQLQTVKRLLAAQPSETKRLSEQVEGLAAEIDSLRQSFASTQSSEASHPRSTERPPAPSRPRTIRGAHRRHAKSKA